MEAELIFIREPANGFQRAPSAQGCQELQQSIFALSTHGEVNVLCVDGGFGIDRREVSSPGDLDVGAETPNLAADFHAGHHLRSRHNRHAEQLYPVLVDQLQQSGEGVIVYISINDGIIFYPLKDGCQCKYGERKTTAPGLHCAWMKKDDQGILSGVRTKCRST